MTQTQVGGFILIVRPQCSGGKQSTSLQSTGLLGSSFDYRSFGYGSSGQSLRRGSPWRSTSHGGKRTPDSTTLVVSVSASRVIPVIPKPRVLTLCTVSNVLRGVPKNVTQIRVFYNYTSNQLHFLVYLSGLLRMRQREKLWAVHIIP